MRGALPSFAARRAVSSQGPGEGLTTAQRQALPPGYDAVAEALASGRCPIAACSVAGRSLASDGVPLGEALAGLRETYQVVRSSAPDFAAVEAVSVAWSEETLAFLQEVSCEDPLTGLATPAHLRARLAEVYRSCEQQGRDVRREHALLVVDVSASRRRTRREAQARLPGVPVDLHFRDALELATVAEGLRSVFAGEETLARVGPGTVVALVRRGGDLGERVAMARAVLADLGIPDDVRLWVEGLPGQLDPASRLVGDLSL